MPDDLNMEEVLAEHLQKSDCGWSMGSFGAIAEFHQDEGEQAVIDKSGDLIRATERGAIRINLKTGASAVAYELPVRRTGRWQHGVALCLPKAQARMGARKVLTGLGEDHDAVRPEHKKNCLYDLGISALGAGCWQVDFCIRTGDEDLVGLLDAHEGQNIFEPGCPVMPAVLQVHPHRIAVTALGRTEVYQPIGGPGTGGKSPEGPHTHLLPKMIRSGRTHNANIVLPEGLTPCAYMHPANPLIDSLGREKDFDAAAFESFQRLLRQWGNAEFVTAKEHVLAEILANRCPDTRHIAGSRLARTGTRLAICQARQRLAETGALSGEAIDRWEQLLSK